MEDPGGGMAVDKRSRSPDARQRAKNVADAGRQLGIPSPQLGAFTNLLIPQLTHTHYRVSLFRAVG
jgi:hypothetical protein